MTVTTTPTLESTIARMAALPEREFRAAVDRDLRRREDEERGERRSDDELESQALRSPALVDRWLTALLAASKSVEGQLSARRMDFEGTKAGCRRVIERLEAVETERPLDAKESAELRAARDRLLAARERYSKSRSGTLRFKSGLDEWIIEARSLRDNVRDRLYDTVVVEERNRLAERVRVLETAIREHRDAFPEDDDPTDADEELWQLVS